MKRTYVDGLRGDTIQIPIVSPIPAGTIKCQMRQTPESNEYHILNVNGNFITIPSIISSTLSGSYVLDVEVSKDDGTVETIQYTKVNIIPDVTRLDGEEALLPNTDLERNKIIGTEFYKRDASGNLFPLSSQPATLVETVTVDDLLFKLFSGTLVKGITYSVPENDWTLLAKSNDKLISIGDMHMFNGDQLYPGVEPEYIMLDLGQVYSSLANLDEYGLVSRNFSVYEGYVPVEVHMYYGGFAMPDEIRLMNLDPNVNSQFIRHMGIGFGYSPWGVMFNFPVDVCSNNSVDYRLGVLAHDTGNGNTAEFRALIRCKRNPIQLEIRMPKLLSTELTGNTISVQFDEVEFYFPLQDSVTVYKNGSVLMTIGNIVVIDEENKFTLDILDELDPQVDLITIAINGGMRNVFGRDYVGFEIPVPYTT